MKLNPIKKALLLSVTLGITIPSFAAVTIYPSNNNSNYTMGNQQQGGFGEQSGGMQQQSPQQQQNTNNSNTQQQQDTSQNQNNNPGTAYDQGYGSVDEANATKEALEDYMQLHSARQEGVTVEVPTYKTHWKDSKERFIWYSNWKGILTEKVGIAPDKVDFEADRLTTSQFNDWANRQLSTLNAQSINVNNP